LLAVLLFLDGYCGYYYRNKIDWPAVYSGNVKITVFQEIILSNTVWMWLYGVFLSGAIAFWFIRRR
jgi:hypothetical protein